MVYLSLPVASLCVIIIFAIQFFAFGTSFDRQDKRRVTSFFPPSLVMDRRVRRYLSIFSALPLTFLFAFFVLHSVGLRESTLNFFVNLLGLDPLTDLLNPLPAFLYAPLTLLFLIYIFPRPFKELRHLIERVIVFLSGLSDYAETRVQAVSQCLLNTLSYNDAVNIIMEKHYEDQQSLPLPEELYTADIQRKLAYHILQLSTVRPNEIGFSSAIFNEVKRTFFDKIGKNTQNKIYNILDTGHIPNLLRRFLLGFVIYLFVVAIWAGLIPLARDMMIMHLGISWPRYAYGATWWPFINHVKSIIAATCVSVVPAVVGIRMLQMRARRTGRPDGGATIGIIVAVFVASLALNLLYLESVLGLDVISKYVTERVPTKVDVTVEISYWVYWLSYSFVACGVVTTVTLAGGGAARGVIVGTSVMGAGYFVAHLFFEIALSMEAGLDRYQFYWHQGSLGGALGVTGLAISAYIFRIRRNHDDPGEPFDADTEIENHPGSPTTAG